jgi:hypothetical protein
MAWSVVLALVLALIAQQRGAERRDRALKVRLAQSLSNRFAQEGMDRILSDIGIDILKYASGVELLRVSKRTVSNPEGTSIESVVTPSGVALNEGVALRAACALLDHRNFGHVNGDDLSDPQVGLRVKRDRSALDILISLEGSSPSSPHQDVWIQIHDEGGKLVHTAGPMCLHDPAFQKLAEELSSR